RQRQGIDLAKSAGLYRGRKPNAKVHEQIIAFKSGGCSIAETARLAGVSVSQVKRVWSQYLAAKVDV
ncbi:helix-turn-helix domain-containing protein, partial [Pseudomonas avellanae]